MPAPRYRRLIIATHNAGKLQEFQTLLQGLAVEIVSAGDLNLPEPVEDGASFAANARLKAEAAWRATGDAALADDSGLCVTALNGEPGIHSARFALNAGGVKDFPAAMRRIHEGIGDNLDRSASFVCALALVDTNGSATAVEGRLNGTIIWPPRGDNGHGYDPFFVPDGETCSFAEMTEAEKNAISHRGIALALLKSRLAQ